MSLDQIFSDTGMEGARCSLISGVNLETAIFYKRKSNKARCLPPKELAYITAVTLDFWQWNLIECRQYCYMEAHFCSIYCILAFSVINLKIPQNPVNPIHYKL